MENTTVTTLLPRLQSRWISYVYIYIYIYVYVYNIIMYNYIYL
jgi:hypothetical protein